LKVLSSRHEIHVLTPLLDGETGPSAPDLPEARLRAFASGRPPALDAVLRRVKSALKGEPAHIYWVERPGLLDALGEEISTFRPDLLHLHGWGTAQLWQREAGIPAVHAPIDAWSLGLTNRLFPSWRTALERGQLRKVIRHERRHYPHFASIVVVGPQDRDFLSEHVPGAHIELIPNGVEPGPVPQPCDVEGILGFHANFATVANVEAARFLIREVLPRVMKLRPDARLLLVGKGASEALDHKLLANTEVASDVADVREYLDRVSVYVAPMTSGTGIKNKLLEAMAAGRPVVTTPLGLSGIGSGGGVFSASSAQGVADVVVRLLNDRVGREEAGRLARFRAVNEFSWEGNAAALEHLWMEAVESNPLK
jgi:glycosyltransferase involved in cell wall biosynthesis